MNSRKKVLVLASWYPSRVKPFLGTFVQRHAEAAAAFNDIAALFVTHDPDIKSKYKSEWRTINGVFTVNLYYRQPRTSFGKIGRYFRAHQIGWRIIQQQFGKPDLIHLNILWRAGIFALYLKKFSGIPYIITENWTGYLSSDASYGTTGYWRKFLTKMIARNSSVIMPVSEDLKNAMQSHGLRSKYQVVHNVVDTSIFSPGSSNKTDKFAFLHVSTGLDEQKNITGILQAVKMLSERNKQFELRIVIEADFSAHERTAAQLGILNQFVFFRSAKVSLGIAEEMRTANCFVLFSNYENLPVVITEAMASGLPVISSAVGGVPEHVTPEMGMLVKPGDVNGLCSAMERMVETAGRYNREKIREYAVKNFSYESIGKKFDEIYKSV